MKSPQTLRQQLLKQWENPATRRRRLLGEPEVEAELGAPQTPFALSIGQPTAATIQDNLFAVKQHLEAWRKVSEGKVIWEERSYRALGTTLSIPAKWEMHSLKDWAQATRSTTCIAEAQKLHDLLQQTPEPFHRLWVSKKSLWVKHSLDELLQVVRVAEQMHPNACQGLPLRTYSVEGIDTKFFERFRTLVIELLDIRFSGIVSQLGLETFVGAPAASTHWLLVADLDGSLLPYPQMRVRAEDLNPPLAQHAAATSINNVLLVENEQCLHLLPPLDNTLAILGAGLDLSWLKDSWLQNTNVGYWGDLDTWGLQMLSSARQHLPQLTPLMMTAEVFESYPTKQVEEPTPATLENAPHLTEAETTLFQKLLNAKTGRLEQEFLSPAYVAKNLRSWAE